MKEIMAICPYFKCQKVIFRKLDIEVKTNSPPIISFTTICPHCKNQVIIKVGAEVKTEIPYK